MEILTTTTFKKMIFETKNIMNNKKDYLNYVNVFPVRDGDTGDNLLKTFNNSRISGKKSLKEFMHELKESLLLSARGNSGVIISQFYKGFCDYLIKQKYVGCNEFAEAINNGCEYAYNAVNNPVEGTMLTVLKGASQGAFKVLDKTESIIDVMIGSFDSAQEYLKKTMNMLPVLKKSGVVDAGGLGVVYMLGAWLRALGIIPEYDPSIENMIVKEQKMTIEKKHCINILLENCSEYEEDVRNVLEKEGDSIQIITSRKYLRIHIHSDNCEKIKNICSAFGKLKEYKTTNMRKQYEKIRN